MVSTAFAVVASTAVALLKVDLLSFTVKVLVIQIFDVGRDGSAAYLKHHCVFSRLAFERALPARPRQAQLLAVLRLLHEVLQIEANFGVGGTICK